MVAIFPLSTFEGAQIPSSYTLDQQVLLGRPNRHQSGEKNQEKKPNSDIFQDISWFQPEKKNELCYPEAFHLILFEKKNLIPSLWMMF